jgi:hypothetical protein
MLLAAHTYVNGEADACCVEAWRAGTEAPETSGRAMLPPNPGPLLHYNRPGRTGDSLHKPLK